MHSRTTPCPDGELGCSLSVEVVFRAGFLQFTGAVVMGILGLRRQAARSARALTPPAADTALPRWWRGVMKNKFYGLRWVPAQLELSDWGIKVLAYSSVLPIPTWDVRYYELRTVQPVTWPIAVALIQGGGWLTQGIFLRPDPSVGTYRSRWSALPLVFGPWRSSGSAEIVAQLERRGVSVENDVARFREANLWT
jgi:hypothetical protein